MACFLVSAAEAIVVTAVEKVEEKKEAKALEAGEKNETLHIPLSCKLRWLTYMLWGGVILLAFEHLWHGEIVPYPPFLTAMSDPSDAAVMLHEMATVGVCMALLITAVWVVMCIAADAIVRRADKAAAGETVE